MKKVLVIDDDPHCVKVLTSRLESGKYEVLVAFDGEEGLEKFKSESPDMVIVDILMPKMDGYTFVRKLKKVSPATPVIILTGQAGMTDLFEVEGVTDYVTKPFKAEDLMKRVKAHLKE